MTREIRSKNYNGPERRNVLWYQSPAFSALQVFAILSFFAGGVLGYSEIMHSIKDNQSQIAGLAKNGTGSGARLAELERRAQAHEAEIAAMRLAQADASNRIERELRDIKTSVERLTQFLLDRAGR